VILCLDAGNSRLKWGLWDGATWLARAACAHAELSALPAVLPAPPTRALACNVAGPAVATRIEALAVRLAMPLEWFRSGAADAGVTNGYERPAQLGDDRWAALIGARGHHTGPALVIMAGTATTIDALDATGAFRGGLILPGLDLMQRALARDTADLPEAQGEYRAMPTNTDDAIFSGCLDATLGAIERMAARMPRRAANAEFLILLSGGAAPLLAPLLAPHLAPPCRVFDNLVLDGLARHDALRQRAPVDLL